MINLIPTPAKKSIVKEYWVRVLSVWMIVWAFALLCGISLILPTYVLINSQVSVYEVSAAEATKKVEDYRNASRVLIDSSQQAGVVVTENRQLAISSLVELFRSLQGNTVQISGIEIIRNEEGVEPVRLDGIATDRQSLASFRDRLQEQEAVSVVDLPISNLARDRDIQFSMTITMVNESES